MSMMIAPTLPPVKRISGPIRAILAPVVEPMPPVAPAADGAYEPSVADRWGLIGLELGRAGALPTASETFSHASERDLLLGSFWFSEGVHTGYGEYAESVGYAMGLAGADLERPLDMPGRFALPFECGHDRGTRDAAERTRIEAEWAAEYAAEMEEREWEESSREAMGLLHYA